MLQPLLRPTGLLLLEFSLAVALMLTLGRQLPDRTPWPDTGFHACALPCWASITPGQTLADDTLPLLKRTLPPDAQLNVSESQVISWAVPGSTPFKGTLAYANDHVSEIALNTELPFGQIVRRLGGPDCIFVDAEKLVLDIYWEMPSATIGAFARIEDGFLRVDTPIRELVIDGAYPICRNHQDETVAWQGFALFRRYEALSP